MAKNTFDDSVGKSWGQDLKVIWHCRRKVCRSSGFIPLNVSGAWTHIWLVAGVGVCTGGTSGVVFCRSLSKDWMKSRIRSSALVDPSGVVICCQDLLKFVAVGFSLEILLCHCLVDLLSGPEYWWHQYGGCAMEGSPVWPQTSSRT